jgi:hypothetical protein
MPPHPGARLFLFELAGAKSLAESFTVGRQFCFRKRGVESFPETRRVPMARPRLRADRPLRLRGW